MYGEFSMSMRTKKPGGLGALEDLPQVVDRARPVDVEAELRQLQREVAADAGRDDRVDDREVVARRGVGLRRGS